MKTRTTLGLATVASCAALIAAVVIGRDGDGKSAPTSLRPPNGPYVALGDSYTAGPKMPVQNGKPAGCDRSDRNYPALVADALDVKPADFRDMSCSGATTDDLSVPQSTDSGVNPAQLSAVSSATRLITLGIGGNDIGFSSMITKCVQSGFLYQMENRIGDPETEDAPCRKRYVSGDTDKVKSKIEAAGVRLSAVLTDMERRAPDARVYVVGYPAILPAKGDGCVRAMGLAPGDVRFLREKEQQLNAMLRDAAKGAGAVYVDTYSPSVGSDACADPDVRWIEPLIPEAAAAPVHPNERGALGMARAVLRAAGAVG